MEFEHSICHWTWIKSLSIFFYWKFKCYWQSLYKSPDHLSRRRMTSGFRFARSSYRSIWENGIFIWLNLFLTSIPVNSWLNSYIQGKWCPSANVDWHSIKWQITRRRTNFSRLSGHLSRVMLPNNIWTNQDHCRVKLSLTQVLGKVLSIIVESRKMQQKFPLSLSDSRRSQTRWMLKLASVAIHQIFTTRLINKVNSGRFI